MQRNWIGRSEGAEITFKAIGPDGTEYDLPVFTTRIDTIFGVTFLAIAPEHPLVMKLTREDRAEELNKYIEEALRKFETERLSTEKEKTGDVTGCFARNPFTNELVPIYVGDYVVYSYGTGAVMGVPAHDERDFQFAKKTQSPYKSGNLKRWQRSK
jgi:Leucyl-tRNA synthetase